MNTRSKSNKDEVEKNYLEALNPTSQRQSHEKESHQPQYTSTPFVPHERPIPSTSSETPTIPIPYVSDSVVRKIISDNPLSNSAFGLIAPPPGTNPLPSPIEEEIEEQNQRSQEISVCADPTIYQSLDPSIYSFQLAVIDSAIEESDKNTLDRVGQVIVESDRVTPEKIERVLNSTNPFNIEVTTAERMDTDMSPPNHFTGSLRYAVEAVPFFDGQNIPLECFEEGCELAKAMLPPENEVFFTKIIHTRLTGEARRSVQGQDFKSISQLLNYLRNLFRPTKNLYELQAELGRIYQKADEEVLSYGNRVKAIGRRILEVHRISNSGSTDGSFQTTLEREMCNSFIRGLTPEIEQRITRNLDVVTTVNEALKIERELSSIKEIRGTTDPSPIAIVESCQICKKPGHTADKCQLRQTPSTPNLGYEILICQICKKRGHSAEKCRFRDSTVRSPVKIVQGSVITCQICSKPGHSAQNCRSFNNAPKIICQTCQRPGHSSKECRSNTYNSNITICQICNKSGHNAKDCYSNLNRNNNFNNETCQWCGRRGHQAAQCRERLNRNSNFPINNTQIICQLCNKMGHKARDCRGSQISGSNPNQTNQGSLGQCRYCKATDHVIENCVLRLESNRRKQGNLSGSPITGATQGTSGLGRPAMLTQAQGVISELP